MNKVKEIKSNEISGLRFAIGCTFSRVIINSHSRFNKPALFIVFFFHLILTGLTVSAQNPDKKKINSYQYVTTYVNPVLPGDHPDPTMLKVGNDFYHCGSSFHFNPYLPVYHSKDMVHWEIISRVVPSAKSAFVADRPSGGIWQGAITHFYDSYWIYFSSGGQWFCKASSPYGPWTDPVPVKTNDITGPLGYDNSIFVDDDGKPYMVIKNGQKVNRIQALGRDGQLTDTVINLDWINQHLQYSWAEGPVMCKRNGWYFYFPAGDVSGGQYVLRTKTLTADSTQWERLGEFFKPVTDPETGFRRPNHISAPLKLEDGSWWTIGQSYEKYTNDDWSGAGRQTALYPVIWEGDRPWGMAPTTAPIAKPNLPKSGIAWRSVQSDYFDSPVLSLNWHFLNRKAAGSYSLTDRKGWIRLKGDTSRAHLVQKETDHFYSAITRVEPDATDTSAKAGLYLTNGNQKTTIRLYSSFDNGNKIILRGDSVIQVVPYNAGKSVWLKLERNGHTITGYYSSNGINWTATGQPVSAVNLDKTQPNYNSWVGTSVGLFAEAQSADFDFFICKDGYSTLPAIGYSNYYGIRSATTSDTKYVTTTTANGGWFMLSGVEFGKTAPAAVEIAVSADSKGTIELWTDDLATGKRLAVIPVTVTGENNWKLVKQAIPKCTGHHDLFIRFLPGIPASVKIKSVRLIK